MIIPDLQKILYVEDEHDIQEVVSMSLEDIGGFELRICSSAGEALQMAFSYNPDLFLLDVMLPDMDGPTLLKKLRATQEFKDTPVIFITAKEQMRDVISSKDMGVLGIIRKPFDPIAISESIRYFWSDYYSDL